MCQIIEFYLGKQKECLQTVFVWGAIRKQTVEFQASSCSVQPRMCTSEGVGLGRFTVKGYICVGLGRFTLMGYICVGLGRFTERGYICVLSPLVY